MGNYSMCVRRVKKPHAANQGSIILASTGGPVVGTHALSN